LTSTQAAPRCKNDGGTVSLRADRGDELWNLVGSGDLAFTGLSRPCSGDIAGVAVDSLIADGCVQDGTEEPVGLRDGHATTLAPPCCGVPVADDGRRDTPTGMSDMTSHMLERFTSSHNC